MKRIEVVAAVILRGGRVLATQRGYGEQKGGWEFPGGKVEPGEDPRAALEREIREELGARVNHKVSDKATVYAGAAWMHEYDGDARVSVQGDMSPAPSMGGSSGMLEVGTTLAPFGSERVLLNLNVSGWTGVQRGISGGAGISVALAYLPQGKSLNHSTPPCAARLHGASVLRSLMPSSLFSRIEL